MFIHCHFYFFRRALYSQNTIVLKPGNAKDIINKNIYGHFAEDLGRCIYGGFYVGEGNTGIANKDGVRLDIIDALKKLKIPVLRWPGGCYADHYHWKDGIGPKDKRKNTENVSWGNVRENNGFGTNEFLNLCETTACRSLSRHECWRWHRSGSGRMGAICESCKREK